MEAYGEMLSALRSANEEMLARSRRLARAGLRGPQSDMEQIVVTIHDSTRVCAEWSEVTQLAGRIARMGRVTNVAVEFTGPGSSPSLADFGHDSVIRSLFSDGAVAVRYRQVVAR